MLWCWIQNNENILGGTGETASAFDRLGRSIDNEKQEIANTKIAYDTKAMIESIIVDIQNKTITR